MAKITNLPDEIIEFILQSIYDDDELITWQRDLLFLHVLTVFPGWIPILLDCRFFNQAGQRSTRYENVWGYRQRVYLDPDSGLWVVRRAHWQPRGTRITGWQCRNGESSHVAVVEEKELAFSEKLHNADSLAQKSRLEETTTEDHPNLPEPCQDAKKPLGCIRTASMRCLSRT